MKNFYDYTGKPPFKIMFLKECLEDEKKNLEWIKNYNPISEVAKELKEKIIEQYNFNIKNLKKEIIAL